MGGRDLGGLVVPLREEWCAGKERCDGLDDDDDDEEDEDDADPAMGMILV